MRWKAVLKPAWSCIQVLFKKKNLHDFSWFVSFFSLISPFLSLHLSPPSPPSVIPPPRTIKESWLDGWIKRWLQGLVDGGMERGREGDRCVVMLGFTSLLRSVREEKKGCEEEEWEGDKQPVERFKEREEKEVGEKVKRKNECLKERGQDGEDEGGDEEKEWQGDRRVSLQTHRALHENETSTNTHTLSRDASATWAIGSGDRGPVCHLLPASPLPFICTSFNFMTSFSLFHLYLNASSFSSHFLPNFFSFYPTHLSYFLFHLPFSFLYKPSPRVTISPSLFLTLPPFSLSLLFLSFYLRLFTPSLCFFSLISSLLSLSLLSFLHLCPQ